MISPRSMVVCLMLVTTTAAVSWWQHGRLTRQQIENRQLAEEAISLGLKVPGWEQSAVVAITKRQRADEEAVVDALVKDLIDFLPVSMDESPEVRRRKIAFHNRLQKLNGSQLAMVLEQLRSQSEGELNAIMQDTIFMMLAGKDPLAAVRLVEESKAPEGPFTVSIVVGKWAEVDPEAAFRWLETRKEGGELYSREGWSVVKGAIKKDVGSAFAIWEKISARDHEYFGYEQLLMLCNTLDDRMQMFRLMQTSVSNIKDGKKREFQGGMAVNAFVSEVANLEGSAARELLMKESLSDMEKKTLASSLATCSDLKDAPGWIKWMEVNLPADQSTKTIPQLVENWTKADYPATTQWLNELPAGPTKEVAARRFAETVAGYDPQGAEQWAETLTDEKARTGTYKTIFKRWPKDDPDGKAAFKTKHGL